MNNLKNFNHKLRLILPILLFVVMFGLFFCTNIASAVAVASGDEMAGKMRQAPHIGSEHDKAYYVVISAANKSQSLMDLSFISVAIFTPNQFFANNNYLHYFKPSLYLGAGTRPLGVLLRI